MFFGISNKIAHYLVNNNMLPKYKLDWCTYFFETKLIQLCYFSAIFFVSSFYFPFVDTLMFILTFMFLRKYSGGYHSSNEISCFVISLSIVILGIKTAHYFAYISIQYSIFFLALSSIIILLFSPVNHPNLRLTHDEMVAMKKKTFIHISLLIIFELILYKLNYYIYFSVITSSCIYVAIMILLSKILKQEEKIGYSEI